MKKLCLKPRFLLTVILLLAATVALAVTIAGTNGTFTATTDAKGWHKTTYTPKTTGAHCNTIYMVQTIRITDGSNHLIKPKSFPSQSLAHMQDDMTANGTAVDHLACEKDPYYNGEDPHKDKTSAGSNNGTTVKATTMSDKPRVPDSDFPNNVNTIKFNFEVCAICKDNGNILDCYNWTYAKTKGQTSTNTDGTTIGAGSSEFKLAKKKFEKTHKNGTECPDVVAEDHPGTGNATTNRGKVTPDPTPPDVPLTVAWDVINTSGVDLFNVEYQVMLDDMPLTNGVIPELPYVDFVTLPVEVPPLPQGPHTLAMMVDPLDLIPEYDETDNIEVWEFIVDELSAVPVSGDSEPRIFMRMLHPNPTYGDFSVMLRLAPDMPARLSVIDVRGRAVYSRTVRGTADALQVEQFHLRGHLGAGMYFVRLEQGGLTASRKFILLR